MDPCSIPAKFVCGLIVDVNRIIKLVNVFLLFSDSLCCSQDFRFTDTVSITLLWLDARKSGRHLDLTIKELRSKPLFYHVLIDSQKNHVSNLALHPQFLNKNNINMSQMNVHEDRNIGLHSH